jgi:glycosyltransferase involved in cell wall biosynthesis
MDKKLSLLYDISVLGMGWFSDTARTGIFRVTENLLKQMVRDPSQYNVNCLASQNNYFQCLEYLKDNQHIFNNIVIPCSKIQYYCDRKVNQSINFKPRRLFFKACQHLLNPFSTHCIDKIARNIDIFHSPYFSIPKIIRKKKKSVKFLTVYDLIPILYPGYFNGRKVIQVKKALNSLSPSDFVICISQSTKNDFCNLVKFDPSRVFVIPLAASGSFFPCKDLQLIREVKKKYGIPSGQYILSVGTLEPRKNIKQLIFSFQRIIEQEKIRDLNLVLVGAKSCFHDKLFAQLNITNDLKKRVVLTGYIPDQDLTPLYSGSLVFVYPSLYEGFGLPPLEAMQCGVPVITSNTSSLPEVVGDAGIMTAPNDSDALCHHILKIYRSSTLRHELANKSFEQAKKFNWPKCANQTIAAYKKALNMNRGS